MIIYTIKRLLQIIPSFFALTAAVFPAVLLMRGAPEFPIPVWEAYRIYMTGVLRGDLGEWRRRSIIGMLAEALPYTLTLAFGGIIVAALIGITLGIIAARKQNKWLDNLIMALSLVTSSIPMFFLAVLLMLLFSLHLGWFPIRGLADGWRGMVMPILTMGLPSVGFIARTTRTAMLDALNTDYIKAARARGIPEHKIVFNHALKNLMIPVITAIGLRLNELLAGTVLVELAFSIPGIGRILLDAITFRQQMVLMGCIIVLALVFMFINLVVDLTYVFVDPRTRKSYR